LSTFSWKKFAFSLSFLLLIPGAIAYAGFFSFLGDMFAKVTPETKPINSQNVALLAASVGASTSVPPPLDDVNTVGGSALLPDVGPSGGPADLDPSFEHGEISIYVVKEGDSLSAIAKMFGVSVNTILWANDLSRGSKITIGQSLLILPVSGVQHEVVKGDTLSAIAKKYHGDPEEILSYNGLNEGDSLVTGTVVIIPDGEIPTVVPAPRKPASSKLANASAMVDDAYYLAPVANYRRTQKLHGYNAVDLTSYLGAPILASAGGSVIVARSGGYNGGYGSYVVIKHGNGTQTLYAHLQSVAVAVGEQVIQGQSIGTLGNTGRSTGPHLHFEVRGARNPFAY
jgi:murein DD-endopeptidase MepM/ murein hydrolase activator NlpD